MASSPATSGATSGESAPRPSALGFRIVTVLALVVGLVAAYERRWVCDDAFISFRYAENFVRGLGLVFNPGERVEGYSNFLWTLWTAFGLRLGADAEKWSKAAGLACYAAALGALAWNAWRFRSEYTDAAGRPRLRAWFPVAALLGALHPDWNIFATSGLETSLVALEVVLLYLVLAPGDGRAWRAVAAGLLLGAAALTRPDGPVLAAATGLFLLWRGSRRARTLALLTAAFLIVWGPYTIWRVGYYGDYFPNTYYAKSGGTAWYSQGFLYVLLYAAKYWPLALGAALTIVAWPRTPGERDGAAAMAYDRWGYRAGLAATLAVVYTAYVVRVGGDFMFARFLIPVTPLLLVLLELALARIAVGSAAARAAMAGFVAAGIVLTPYPLPRDPFASVGGIVFEPNYYSREASDLGRNQGLRLRRCFEGLPVRLAFYGGEARLVYYARPEVAIECATGLTDSHIAHQPLLERGRVGHEKRADLAYVLETRKAQLAFFRFVPNLYRLGDRLPLVEIDARGVHGWVLTWEPALIESLRARGAVVQDFPADLDRLLAEPSLSFGYTEWLQPENLRRFYFANTSDSAREALWLRRIREAKGG